MAQSLLPGIKKVPGENTFYATWQSVNTFEAEIGSTAVHEATHLIFIHNLLEFVS